MDPRIGGESGTTPTTGAATQNSQLLLAVVIRTTPAPTSCEHESKWYVSFNPCACTNQDNPRGALFNSAKICYKRTFDTSSGDHACRHINGCSDTNEPTLDPTTCEHERRGT